MKEEILSVREMETHDVPLVVNYWHSLSSSDMMIMGVDVNKIPPSEQFSGYLLDQIATPIEKRNSYGVIWLVNDLPVGHSNTNPAEFGKEAFMHLHLWKNDSRRKGMGTEFLRMTLPYFFRNLKLKDLYCQPYALNPAPHRTLEKLGFEFVKEYITTPGSLNFEQPVKLWRMSNDRFSSMYNMDDRKGNKI